MLRGESRKVIDRHVLPKPKGITLRKEDGCYAVRVFIQVTDVFGSEHTKAVLVTDVSTLDTTTRLRRHCSLRTPSA